MLGDHHMQVCSFTVSVALSASLTWKASPLQSKMVFYEGSVHIPLIMRLPGVIPASTVVQEPVSNMALFATIVDYLGVPAPAAPSTSESLRPLIEGTGGSKDRVIFSFWDSDVSPGYMVFDGRFKLMIGRQAKTDGARCDSAMPCVDEQGFDAPGVDARYGESRRSFLRSWYVASLLLLNNQTWPQT